MKQKQFEEHFKTLELSKTKDSWGNEIYAHSHVQAIWDGWVAALTQPKADVDGLANYIRAINGDNTMGAGELAEKITDHLAARGCFGVPDGYALVPLDLLHKAKVLINFHVKRGACIDINDKLFNEGEIYGELNKLWTQAFFKAAPKKEGA